jgi:hypothetical protein
MTLIWAGLYVAFAFLVMRWNRGILPVAAALAIIMAIFAAIAAPHWFARDKVGLSSPALPEDVLGVLTVIVIPVQLVLVAVSMIGFNQNWHVEEERPVGDSVPAAYDDDEDADAPRTTATADDDKPSEADDADDDGERASPKKKR